MKIMMEGFWMIMLFSALLSSQTSNEIRRPEVAGMFYPGNSQQLTKMIDEYLAQASVEIEGEIGGLVSPHAGYIYSGPVAAWSYKQVEGKFYDVVVVIAPSHFEYFSGSSVFPGQYYETPLGKLPVDQDLAARLAKADKKIMLSENGHAPGSGGRSEHSLEVQLPFLQRTVGEVKILPIVMADQSWENVRTLGNALAEVLKEKKALIIASSDLSHYHAYDRAYELDENLMDFFVKFEFHKLLNACERRQIEACGYGPISVMMYACSELGYKKSKVLKYATSGDVPVGEKAQVVGYLSGAVYK